MNKKISILLPTYNEHGNIIPLIERTIKAVPQDKEIIVIDDNSPDGTAGLVEQNFTNNPAVRLIVRKDERGLCSAVQRGINEANGDIIAWMDCDLSMPPEKFPELIDKIIEEDYDAAVGSRYVKGGKDRRTDSGKCILHFHTALSSIIVKFTSFVLDKSFKDWTSGFIAVKSSVIKTIPLKGDYGEFFIEMMYRLLKKGYKVIEVPYELIPRQQGQSKTATNIFGFFKRGFKYVFCVLKLRFSKII
ncbi:MAG: glycosyltransferase [Phycisphaerae bacterium]